jgi:hypothetical protein
VRLAVRSAALREELGVYRAAEIRAALQAELPALGVRDVRFETE